MDPIAKNLGLGSGIDISTAIELSLFISMEILDSNLWLVPFAGKHASWYDTASIHNVSRGTVWGSTVCGDMSLARKVQLSLSSPG